MNVMQSQPQQPDPNQFMMDQDYKGHLVTEIQHQELISQLEQLKQLCIQSDDMLKKVTLDQEMFIIQYQESTKRQYHLEQLQQNPGGQNAEAITKLQKEKAMLDQALRSKAYQMIQNRMDLIAKYHDAFFGLRNIQTQVLERELVSWKRRQQLSGNGITFENNLDQIQDWCESLAELLMNIRLQLKRLEQLILQLPLNSGQSSQGNAASAPSSGGPLDKINDLFNKVSNLLTTLVTNTFVIEKQPPQVMKTNTRFTSTVRLLVGGKLNVQMNPPQVKAVIISEAQANAFIRSEKGVTECSGEILNNMGMMEYHQATRQLSVHFRNMQLRKIKRAEKKGTESVMDEKFSLLFTSVFKVGGGDMTFQVWTCSLPVVVIVHGNQEPHAWATVTWDNAFAENNRPPFVVPDKVYWPQLGEVLSNKFRYLVGRPLTEDSLHFLAGKIIRNHSLPDYKHCLASWSQFAKEALPDRNFTFWEWFYALLKVTKEHLRGPWSDGLIMGFVGRKQAEDMLLAKPIGTFLLRYSDSELGGLTIAWVGESQDGSGNNEVLMLQPFTGRDFQIRGLADRINDLKNLIYLYPDVPKDQVFGKYYTALEESQPRPGTGYVKPILVTHIPGISSGACSFDSYPNTPQSTLGHNPHSPSDGSIAYHDTASAQCSTSEPMMNTLGNGANGWTEMDYNELMNMDFSQDIDIPVDFSNFNVNDLMGGASGNATTN